MADKLPDMGALPPASMPWARAVSDLTRKNSDELRRLANDQSNTNSQLEASINLLTSQVVALPVPSGYFVRSQGFGLNSGTVYVQQLIVVPPAKTKVVLTAIGNVYVLDKTSGGAAVAQASIEASGPGFTWSTPFVYASKDAGASVVANIMTPALGFQQVGLTPGSSFMVAMALTASNPTAYPADATNYGTLTVTAIFFD
jgi:hypothetical protein